MPDQASLDGARPVAEGEELWRPTAEFVRQTGIARFQSWLVEYRGLTFHGYDDLWAWSTTDLTGFWSAIWDHYDVISSTPYEAVLEGGPMMGTRWFPGSQVNFTEHALRFEAQAPASQAAILHATETQPLAAISWRELGDKVRSLATSLRAMGIGPGDPVVSYMPNVPETVIAMLACAAVGAVWAAAAPEFGAKTVIERFGQVAPKLAFMTDGYVFGGKRFERSTEARAIVAQLPSLTQVVWHDQIGSDVPAFEGVGLHRFADLVAQAAPGPDSFVYERVPCDHPLWVLFSSGTTGKPKAIVHSHVGIIVEQLKHKYLHCNQSADDCAFFYATTGWVVWNALVCNLLAGTTAVLFDGSPMHAGPQSLWRLAEEARVTQFGASPTLVHQMKRDGVRPRELFNLDRLNTVMMSGSPATADVFQWFYTEVKKDLWVSSQSGGTEIAGCFVGGVPTLPVRAGEIQARLLGMDVHAWSDDGREVVGEVGELVVTKPFPSMPMRFLDDPGDLRYKDAYFNVWPDVWRHGDLIRINENGSCMIIGRSDATLNRYGVRIGSAEIYGVVERIEEVADSLIVCCELPDGGFFMPLFVKLAPGVTLDDALKARIRQALKAEASPRHVPDEIWQAPAIPYTLTGKRMEVPVRRLLMGVKPSDVATSDAMAEPAALDWFVEFAGSRRAQQADG